ncbi:hypothetical protein M758_9G020500 [Ceratodon purpureus]|nr:hypothetical protein M758_9G020500 [Ceratodon purpureus]
MSICRGLIPTLLSLSITGQLGADDLKTRELQTEMVPKCVDSLYEQNVQHIL